MVAHKCHESNLYFNFVITQLFIKKKIKIAGSLTGKGWQALLLFLVETYLDLWDLRHKLAVSLLRCLYFPSISTANTAIL